MSPLSIAACREAYHRQTALPGGIKVWEDLARYLYVIGADAPELLIETGTWAGASARWFAQVVPSVWTIDVTNLEHVDGGVFYLRGDSGDPATLERLERHVHGRRTMVVLDSDHSRAHVAAELLLWAPLVSPGCHLVVEDTLCHWLPQSRSSAGMDTWEAIWGDEYGGGGWRRAEGQGFVVDRVVEDLFPASQHPGGWLKREAVSA